MKFRRSERIIDMTHYLLEHPHQLISLTLFAERFGSAKSSISEDLAIIKDTFEKRGIGTLQTVPGAAGGVKFYARVDKKTAAAFIEDLCRQIEKPDRLLPGGYLYIMDLLGNPAIMNQIGKMLASAYADQKIDAVMTVAAKGIPIAHAIAAHLNVPVVVVRRDSKVTEGPTVSINYVSGSTKRIQAMVLSKRSLKEGSRVLLVDDFMKGGGTINGMVSLLSEFNASVAGIAVIVESEYPDRLIDDYISLVKLKDVNEKTGAISVVEGNYFNKNIAFLEGEIES